jgi:hypothetical protein
MTETDERPGESSLRVSLTEHTLEGLSRVVRKAHRAGVPDGAEVILGRRVVTFRWADDDDLEDDFEDEDSAAPDAEDEDGDEPA